VSWIPLTAPADAPDMLRAIYERIRSRSSAGRVAHVWQSQGRDPVSLAATFEL